MKVARPGRRPAERGARPEAVDRPESGAGDRGGAVLAHRREAATQRGADLVLDPTEPDVVERIHAVTGGLGVDVAAAFTATERRTGLKVVVAPQR